MPQAPGGSSLHMDILVLFFFFNATATTEIYTLSLHDALPIFAHRAVIKPSASARVRSESRNAPRTADVTVRDRKSTRLNSSHPSISYAVFCLKKKNGNHRPARPAHRHHIPPAALHRHVLAHDV